MFHTLVRAGYSFNDLKYVYTIPQVWLFYEEEKKRQITAQKDLAIVIANACAVAQPADILTSIRQTPEREKTQVKTKMHGHADHASSESLALARSDLSSPIKAEEDRLTLLYLLFILFGNSVLHNLHIGIIVFL